MIFQQLFDQETWTYTYLLGDESSKEAVFIDPVITHIDEYMALLEKHGLTLKYSLETHVHADHITASGLLRKRTGAETGVSENGGAAAANIQFKGGEVLTFGNEQLKVIPTPGHTPGCTSYLWGDRIFSGDALFIDGCGRTDFPDGSAGDLYDSVTQHLFTLPGDTIVYPGHDYNGRWISTIEQERTRNPRLAGKTKDEFVEIMDNLNLPLPKLINAAVPANQLCGLTDEEWEVAMKNAAEEHSDHDIPQSADPMPTGTTPQALVGEAKAAITEIDVTAAKIKIAAGEVVVIDVREPEEHQAGAIDIAIHLPRGVLEFKLGTVQELANKSAPVLLYCRTGGRSALAAHALQKLGYTDAMSMAGGYEAWIKM